MKDLIVGTAGHIDHGKTALVRALTGIDTDRLEEEKRRGITIDLGFAHTLLGDYRIGFVDVPGHERFVKNMLSGIGGIQFLLLVVAADESVMPQTVEHFHICTLLEIPSGIIVITKKNQVDQELLEVVQEEISGLVKGSFLDSAPVLSVDSLTGEGISELREVLQRQIGALDEADRLTLPVDRIFRLPIDRVFTIKGFGTVVTGTPLGGEIRREETIAVYPGGQTGKIRGIQIFGEKTDCAKAGQRTALNVSGIAKDSLERGIILGSPDLLKVSKQLDVSLRLLENAPRALHHKDPIRFHHGSGEILGRIHLGGSGKLQPDENTLAQIRLDVPTVCLPGDHFVLRRYSPLTTIGGGIVLDGAPLRWRKKNLDERLTRLRKIQSALESSDGPRFEILVEQSIRQNGILGIDLKGLSSSTGLMSLKLEELAGRLDTVLKVPADPPIFVTKESVDGLRNRICDHLQGHHAAKPLSFGLSREELKERFLPGGSGPFFQFLLGIWQQDGLLEVHGGNVALKGPTVSLTPEQENMKNRILDILDKSGLNTLTLDEVTKQFRDSQGEARDVLFYLLETGKILRISGDMLVLPSQVLFLKKRLRNTFGSGESFNVAQFKELFSVSRKYAIPLLEFLDRQKVTRRVGDKRVVV